MKQPNIILASVLASNLVFGASAVDEQERALQRAHDLSDKTPLSYEESALLRSMVAKGTIKVRDDSAGLPEMGSENRSGRALKKESKHHGEKRDEAGTSSRTRSHTSGQNTASHSSRTTGYNTASHSSRTNGYNTASGNRQYSHSQTRAQPSNTGRTVPANIGRSNPPPQKEYYGAYEEQEPESQYYSTYEEQADYDDFFVYYDDAPSGDDFVQVTENDDDFFTFEDDDSNDDGNMGGVPNFPIYLPLLLPGLQDASALQPFVPVDPSLPDEFSPGTVYLYSNEPVYGLDGESFGASVNYTDMYATASGKCTRTDPNDELDAAYVGKAYCQFSYDFLDEEGETEAQLTAEGPVELGDFSVLAITGGTSFFRRTVGQIHLWPVDDMALPVVEAAPTTDLPASYFVESYIFLDLSLIALDLFDDDTTDDGVW